MKVPCLVALCLALVGLTAAPRLHAQSLTEVPSITVGYNTPPGPGIPFQEGFTAGSYGSISKATTADGYTFVAFYDQVRGGKIGSYFRTLLLISGFTADPGQSWLVSAAANGVTLAGSSAVYTFANGQAQWAWTGGPVFIDKPSPATATFVHGGDAGYLDLKWQVLGVDYAPPGAQSSVTYANSNMRGTMTMNSNTFKNTVNVAVSGDVGVNLFGFVGGGLTATTTTEYSQQSGSSSSVTLASTTTRSDIVRGPSSSSVGVDHDADVVWVWVNPISIEFIGPNTVAWGGYAFNAADDTQTMEVIPLYVAWLKNPALMPSNVVARLARSWDQTGLGGLTVTDFANIMAADPFATSDTYNPAADASHRFDLVSNATIPYVPASPGLQPITRTGSIATQTTTSQGQNAQTSYSVGFTLDFSAKLDFIAQLASEIKVTNTYATTDAWSSTINTQTGQTATYSITGPAAADNYSGPVSFDVWRDNIYGSFMFFAQ